tara:strand:- start:152 stop:493 length:342 start_codon:yes stop_codon:yes gene_type:complete
MEIKGKLVKKLEQEAGTSKAGNPYVKQICIVETDNKYNPQIAIQCFGEDKIKQMNKLREGDMVAISCNIYSEEWKGRYFNKIDGWWFVKQNEKPTENRNEFVTTDDDDNDLPF